jgi:FdhD protein
VAREWVPEEPIALEFNGLSYAVMMASPSDLEDFARGFALSEGLAKDHADILDVAVAHVDLGTIVRAQIRGVGVEQLTERVRSRVAESSCGLCGIENLEAVAKPLPDVGEHEPLAAAAVFRALDEVRQFQELNHRTGAAHAAAYADNEGNIVAVREDVGRHNAVDKLIGAMALSQSPEHGGFFLSTARCSYEIVEKVVRAGGTSLVTISLPTTMAVKLAKQCGLSLYCLARSDSFLKL